jgi:hypothetical protein
MELSDATKKSPATPGIDPGTFRLVAQCSMDRSIRIFRHLEQVFEPYCIMLKELKEKKKSSSPHSVSAKKRETLKNTKTLFSGTVSDSRILAFREESQNPNSARTRDGCTRMQLAVC